MRLNANDLQRETITDPAELSTSEREIILEKRVMRTFRKTKGTKRSRRSACGTHSSTLVASERQSCQTTGTERRCIIGVVYICAIQMGRAVAVGSGAVRRASETQQRALRDGCVSSSFSGERCVCITLWMNRSRYEWHAITHCPALPLLLLL